MSLTVLGIESSCDETGIAIYDSEQGLLAHHVYSQTEIHAQYGGVVPELASRDHIRKTLPMIQQTMADCQLTQQQINGVCYTKGPGLIGALMVGASIARSIGWAWRVPTVGVHHMEAHLMAVMLEENKPEYPFIALIVSGGHTMLVEVNDFGRYKLLGESVDDAAGEAFDKTAKMLGLPYPGGALLAELALQGRPDIYEFPRPMVNRPGLDFSFSGLKTHTLTCFKQSDQSDQAKADIAYAFEDAVVDTLAIKCKRALQQTHLKRLVMVGGVSANKKLRQRLRDEFSSQGVEVYYPRPAWCTDNGAMVAYTGCQRLLRGESDSLQIKVNPRWPLSELQ